MKYRRVSINACPEKAEWSVLHGYMGSRHRQGHKGRKRGQERRMGEKAEDQPGPCHHFPPLGTEEDENFLFPRE